jgi:hypothetical protein
MTNDQPLHKIPSIEKGKSIFPPFPVNVPMPAGTAVPPLVVVTPQPSAGTAPTISTSTSPSQDRR